VIADFQMPGIDGATLASTIAGDSLLDRPVFIMLTSGGHWKEISAVGNVGVDAALLKPVPPIRNYWKRWSMRGLKKHSPFSTHSLETVREFRHSPEKPVPGRKAAAALRDLPEAAASSAVSLKRLSNYLDGVLLKAALAV